MEIRDIKLTRKEVAELLYFQVVWGYNYIAKDSSQKNDGNCNVSVFKSKPKRNNVLGIWQDNENMKEPCTQEYNFLSWEEAVSIDFIIQEYHRQERGLLLSLLYVYIEKGEIYPPSFEDSVIKKVIDFLEEDETNSANIEFLNSMKNKIGIE